MKKPTSSENKRHAMALYGVLFVILTLLITSASTVQAELCSEGSYAYPVYIGGPYSYTYAEIYPTLNEAAIAHPGWSAGLNPACLDDIGNAGWGCEWLYLWDDSQGPENLGYVFYPAAAQCSG